MSVNIGVGVIIANRQEQVLLGKRLSKHGQHTWGFPGGLLEQYETPTECAIRETFEETGLIISNVAHGTWTYDHFEESNKKCITLFMIARHNGDVPLTKEPEKCAGWQWFHFDTLPQPLFKPVISLIQQGFSAQGLRQSIR